MRTLLAVVLAAALAAPAASQSPAPSADPGAAYTAADYKALTAARVERVLAAYARLTAWLSKTGAQGQALAARLEKDGAQAMGPIMDHARASSPEEFTRQVGMTQPEFAREWGLVISTHAWVMASDAAKAGLAQLQATIDDPNVPEAVKGSLREQKAAMEKQFATGPDGVAIPAETLALVTKYRAKINALLGTPAPGTAEPGAAGDQAVPGEPAAPESAPADQ